MHTCQPQANQVKVMRKDDKATLKIIVLVYIASAISEVCDL